jgi:hypothetical protein
VNTLLQADFLTPLELTLRVAGIATLLALAQRMSDRCPSWK